MERRRATVEGENAVRLDEARLAALRERAEEEPLEYVNAVQGFAALVAVDAEFRVVHASGNCASFFGLGSDFGSVVGRTLDVIFDRETAMELQETAEECRKLQSTSEGAEGTSESSSKVEMKVSRFDSTLMITCHSHFSYGGI
eukprot:tig00020999_g16975.t1